LQGWTVPEPKTSVVVIIPACNEQAVIAKCLRAIVGQEFDGPLEVLVAVNGSTDRTANIVESERSCIEARGWSLHVCNTPIPSKTAALNLGDSLADADVRIYLDADAVISPNTIDAIARALDGNEARLAAPSLVVTPGKGWISRAYADVWRRLPPISDDVVGGGCYAVNRVGRARFAQFPNVISDDGYVRMLFSKSERLLVKEASFEIGFPDSPELLKVLARKIHGNMELAKMGLAADDPYLLSRRIRTVVASPSIWFSLAVFMFIRYRARKLAHRRFRHHIQVWERATRRSSDPQR
jgi:glycosyltransferase involved in cell wall biosynthesis